MLSLTSNPLELELQMVFLRLKVLKKISLSIVFLVLTFKGGNLI